MEKLKLGKFMRKVYKNNRDIRRPIRGMIELTYKCNHKCLHCYNPDSVDKKEMTTGQIYKLLDELVELGNMQLAFTGGEIFMRPDIMDIVLYARKKGIRVTLMTNGALLTDEKVDTLISWGVTSFEISFLGASEQTFDDMTQTAGSYKRVISVIKMLRSKGVIPRVKTCVTMNNIDEVDRIAELTKELNVSFSYSPLVIPKLDLGQEPGNYRIDVNEFLDIRKRFAKFHNRSKKKTRDVKIKKQQTERLGFWEKDCLFSCMAGHTGVFINPYGEMKACMTVPEPSCNVLEHGVAKCWENIKEYVDKLKAPDDWECYICEYQDWCSWCPGRGYLNTGNVFGCPPYFKELAIARKARYEQNKLKQNTGNRK